MTQHYQCVYMHICIKFESIFLCTKRREAINHIQEWGRLAILEAIQPAKLIIKNYSPAACIKGPRLDPGLVDLAAPLLKVIVELLVHVGQRLLLLPPPFLLLISPDSIKANLRQTAVSFLSYQVTKHGSPTYLNFLKGDSTCWDEWMEFNSQNTLYNQANRSIQHRAGHLQLIIFIFSIMKDDRLVF